MKLLFAFLVICLGVHAGIEEYFKKITDKPSTCRMKNIDCIYMINLDERPEKYESCMKRLVPYNIFPYRFSAVNGWELSLESINELGVKFGPWMEQGLMATTYLPENKGQCRHEEMNVHGRTYFSHCMARGAIGIVLSHLSVLQDAYDSGYETIWVMEDDIEVIRDPHVLSDLIEQLDSRLGRNGWDILFTDQDTVNNDGERIPCSTFAHRPNFSPFNPYRFAINAPVNSNIRRIGSRYGAYSMIVSRSGMKKILNFFKNYHIFLPYDMEYTQPEDIQLFTVIDDVVTTLIMAPSDNGAPNYKKSGN